jgi:uncharacterized membrane protein YfcA
MSPPKEGDAVPELTWLGWLGLGLGALGVGFSKTAIGGVATIAVAIYASVLPSKASTGTLLLLLLTGDLVAIWLYRHDVAWRDLARMVAPVVTGVLTGVVFMRFVSDAVLKTTMGVLLLALVGLHLGLEWHGKRTAAKATIGGTAALPHDPRPAPAAAASSGAGVSAGSDAGSGSDSGGVSRPGSDAGSRSERTRLGAVLGYGALAGFCTMVANAGGAAMNLYLLSGRFPMMRFLGTGAWFFFAVNSFKVPFSIGLGLITTRSLWIWLVLAPVVLVGTWLGRCVIARLNQTRFNQAALLFTAVSAVFLLF